jgi:hypothetical protein
MRASEVPGDSEVEQSFSHAQVFAWFSDLPWQIKRAVYVRAPKRSAGKRTACPEFRASGPKEPLAGQRLKLLRSIAGR